MTAPTDKAVSVLGLLERERRFLAEELHEGLCQNLCGISIQLKILERRLKVEAPQFQDDFAALLNALDETIDQTRFLYRTLKPPISNSEALAAAIGELAKAKQIAFKCEDSFSYYGETLSDSQAIGLFRIAQEAVRAASLNPAIKLTEIALIATDIDSRLSIRFHESSTPFETQSSAIMAAHARQIGATKNRSSSSRKLEYKLKTVKSCA